MSKISEQKALEAYPREIKWIGNQWSGSPEDINIEKRYGYIVGYDQAMQDFLEKAEMWLEPTLKNLAGYNSGGDLINDFKNYMKDEIQD